MSHDDDFENASRVRNSAVKLGAMLAQGDFDEDDFRSEQEQLLKHLILLRDALPVPIYEYFRVMATVSPSLTKIARLAAQWIREIKRGNWDVESRRKKRTFCAMCNRPCSQLICSDCRGGMH